jgi:uncharacterized protein (TIGR00297 family)
VAQDKLAWQSKLVLLVVVPCAAIGVLLASREWALNAPTVAVWTLGLSSLLGLLAWGARAATPSAAATGFVISASVMFSTVVFPYHPWQTALIPVVTVLVLTSAATRFGRRGKERLGIAEKRRGRGAAQVAANLGVAALTLEPAVRSWISGSAWMVHAADSPGLIFSMGLAALAEAAADTISSEIGQVIGGTPRTITSFRRAAPGEDGAISFAGTMAGMIAAGVVAASGTWALRGDGTMFAVSWAGGVFGLFFDSVLGATVERRGWLNNDAVNFLSTASATGFALMMVALLSQHAR